ncbi:MAG: M48 family metalloprotease [Alphaproteobacteria bacterium]|nr:M48 family metalloprotease [Alphaproteobacteria bacterium]
MARISLLERGQNWRRIGLFALAASLATAALPAQSQSLIRDAEIEKTLSLIARPIFKAAGVNPSSIEVLVVNDPSLNAFVVNNRAIFLNSGLITRLKTIGMLQAVIGHELAHITSGHLIRRTINQQSASTAIGIGLLLATIAAANGNGQAAGGIAAGVAGSAIGKYLAHTRAEETTADQISVRYMVRAGVDPKAALDVMEIFRGQEALTAGRQDAYARTHPMSSARIRALKGQIAAYGGGKITASPTLQYWHARMVAKFKGYFGNPAYVLRNIKKGDRSEAARLTRAMAYYRQGRTKSAVGEINALLVKRLNDPYYYELKGQILLEGGRVTASINAYKTAVSILPKQSLILAGYGRALLSLKSKSGNRAALKVLRKARQIDPRDPHMLRDLAVSWAKSGDNGMASLVTAQRYALLGRFKDAKTNATRAEGLLPRGSSGWLRSQDIIAASTTALAK